MANQVRRLGRDESKSLVPLEGFNRPAKYSGTSRHQEIRNETYYPVERFDPYRARLAQIAHPILRQLRASKWSPKDRENTNKGLLEQLLYMAEMKLEG